MFVMILLVPNYELIERILIIIKIGKITSFVKLNAQLLASFLYLRAHCAWTLPYSSAQFAPGCIFSN